MSKVPLMIVGPRQSDFGVAIAPSGVDAYSAPPSALLVHLTSALPQLYMRGVAAPSFPQSIPHALGYAPLVFPNLMSEDLQGLGGRYVRPFDNSWGPYDNSQIRSEATQIVVLQTGAALSVNYFVVNRMAP